MNNEEAQFILRAYRPGGQDADDPQFAEALQMVRSDPQLAVWFAEEMSLDAAIGSKLRDTRVPADLRAAILAGRNMVERVPGWRRGTVWALAASVVFLLALAAVWLRPPGGSSLAAYRNAMAEMLSSGQYQLGNHNESVENLQQWLSAHQGVGDFALPAGMKNFPGYGCVVLNWNEKKVTMLCLRSRENGIVHLFVLDRRALPDAPPPGATQFAKAGEWMTASWTQGDKIYLLASGGDREALQRML